MSGDYTEGNGSGAAVILTRADWDNTQPTAPISLDAPAAVIAMLKANEHFNPYTDKLLGNVENSAIYQADLPSSKAKNGLTLSDMRGLSYLDAKWEDFLDQMDYGDSNIISLVGAQGYCTTAYTALGIPYTTDLDGPMGITKQANVNNDSWCAYASGPVLAATWNTSLAYAMGQAVGQEALTTGVTGWYAPGLRVYPEINSGHV